MYSRTVLRLQNVPLTYVLKIKIENIFPLLLQPLQFPRLACPSLSKDQGGLGLLLSQLTVNQKGEI